MIHKSATGKEIIAAVDLGSSHCLTLIASREPDGSLRIIGLGNVPTRGVRRATIINLEEATKTLTRSVAQAEQMCGNNIDHVYMNVSGQHIASQNSSGVVVVADTVISEGDVDRAIESARAVSMPADREVLNLTPRFYTIDGQDGILDPINMVGTRLEVDIHMITASSSALRNLEKALNDVELERESFVFSGYAASEVCLSEAEKNAGVICIDIGSDTTSYCVYLEDAITLSGVVPIGGRYVSQDINAYTKVGLENAEKIKFALAEDTGSIEPQREGESREEYRKRLKQADVFNLTAYDPNVKPQSVSRLFLIRNVIGARHKEIFQLIADELKKHKLLGKLGAGAIVVGGAAKTVGLTEVAAQTLGMQVRVGMPKGIDGVIRHLDDPMYATAIGLLHYAVREQTLETVEPEPETTKTPKAGGIWDKLKEQFSNLMP